MQKHTGIPLVRGGLARASQPCVQNEKSYSSEGTEGTS
jgi:hypothetical protein